MTEFAPPLTRPDTPPPIVLADFPNRDTAKRLIGKMFDDWEAGRAVSPSVSDVVLVLVEQEPRFGPFAEKIADWLSDQDSAGVHLHRLIDALASEQRPVERTPTISAVVDAYVSIVLVNGTAKDVIDAIDDEWGWADIVYELLETARDMGRTVDDDDEFELFENELPGLRARLASS